MRSMVAVARGDRAGERIQSAGTIGRQVEAEPGAAERGVVVCPDSPVVRFNNRLADRQAHAHAAFLGREKAVEETREMRWINPRAAVLDHEAHRFRARQNGPNKNVSAPGPRHGVDRVDGEVHNNLLKLGTVTDDPAKPRFQVERNGDIVGLELMPEEIHQLLDDIGERMRCWLQCSPASHGTDPVNDVGRSSRVGHHTPGELPHLLDVEVGSSEAAEAGLAVGDDGGKWLVDFVRDRGRQDAEARDLRQMREFRTGFAPLLL